MKDVPVDFPAGLWLPVVLTREDPRDAFISNHYTHPEQLPAGARVGTSSLRRQCQLVARYPTLNIVTLRGNVNSRLAKLDAGNYDALILAAAGLKRLCLASRIASYLEPEVSLPAIGQGALGIECRKDDTRVFERIQMLEDYSTHLLIKAERAMNARLQGGCQVPIAGYATLEHNQLFLRGLVGDPDGSQLVTGEIRGPAEDAERLGTALGEELLVRGAADILRRLYGAAAPVPDFLPQRDGDG
jgi:hydroxymethylbilane synthase